MTSDLPPPGPEDIVSDDPASRPPRSSRSSRRSARAQQPNYTARRAAVGAAVVAVLVAAVAVVSIVIGGDDDGDSTVVEPGWDTIIEVDRVSGAIAGVDADGAEVVELDGRGRVGALHVRGDRLALIGNEQVVLVELTEGTSTVIEIDRSSTVFRHPSSRSFTLVVAPEIGGEIVVVDAAQGTRTALGERAGQRQPLLLPETLRIDRTGTRFAVGDGRNFQTIVVDADPELEPTFYPGVPMGLDADTVVTSTNVGRNAELGFFATDGTRLGLVSTPRPVAGVVDDDRFVYLSEDGRLLSASPTDDEPDELADLGLTNVSVVAPVDDATKLLMISPRRLLIVDLEGGIIHDDELGTDDDPLTGPSSPWSTWRCAPIMGADGGAIIDLGDGEVLDELPAGELLAVTPDGCGVHVRTSDADDAASADLIITRSGTFAPRGEVRTVVLAPDGTAALVVAPDGNVELVTIDDGRRLDLGARRGLLAFAHR